MNPVAPVADGMAGRSVGEWDHDADPPSRYNTTSIGNWLRLARAPNLLTVPGDPVAGFLWMAPTAAWHTHHVWCAMAAALCFYAGGTIFNDVMDISLDRNKRPWRPLPFGLISVVKAEGVAFLLMAMGLGFCVLNGLDAIVIGICLSLAIAAYNLELKHIPWLGPMGMGFCRALSVLLGVFAAPGNPPMNQASARVAAAVGLYVVGLTLYARYERRAAVPLWVHPAPLAGFLGALFLAVPLSPWSHGMRLAFSAAPLLVLAGITGGLAIRGILRRGREEPSSEARVISVGGLLRGILMLQILFVLMSGGGPLRGFLVVLLLGAWPLHAFLERTYYST